MSNLPNYTIYKLPNYAELPKLYIKLPKLLCNRPIKYMVNCSNTPHTTQIPLHQPKLLCNQPKSLCKLPKLLDKQPKLLCKLPKLYWAAQIIWQAARITWKLPIFLDNQPKLPKLYIKLSKFLHTCPKLPKLLCKLHKLFGNLLKVLDLIAFQIICQTAQIRHRTAQIPLQPVKLTW